MRDVISKVFQESDRGPYGVEIRYLNNFWFVWDETAAPEIDVNYEYLENGKCKPFEESELVEESNAIFVDKAQHERIRRHCMALLEAVKTSGDDPFPALDSVFSNLLDFKLHAEMTVSEEVVIKRAVDLLSRMPDSLLSLAEVESGHFSRQALSLGNLRRTNVKSFRSEEWNNLSVVTLHSTNTIRLAIAVAADIFWVQNFLSGDRGLPMQG